MGDLGLESSGIHVLDVSHASKGYTLTYAQAVSREVPRTEG